MRRDHVGFDPDLLTSRFVQWCVEHCGPSVGAGKDDPEVVTRFLENHVAQHGAPALSGWNGALAPGPRCLVHPCKLARVAFAVFELDWYFANLAQAQEAYAYQLAADALPVGDPRRAKLELELIRFPGHLTEPVGSGSPE